MTTLGEAWLATLWAKLCDRPWLAVMLAVGVAFAMWNGRRGGSR